MSLSGHTHITRGNKISSGAEIEENENDLIMGEQIIDLCIFLLDDSSLVSVCVSVEWQRASKYTVGEGQ